MWVGGRDRQSSEVDLKWGHNCSVVQHGEQGSPGRRLVPVPATLHRRWGGYLTVVLLIGLVGGVAMGAAGAARRTQSAFPTVLANTDASDLDVQIGTVGGYASMLFQRPSNAPIAADRPPSRRGTRGGLFEPASLVP
jgi:hypothetical protein